MRERSFHAAMAIVCLALIGVSFVGMRAAQLYFDEGQLTRRVTLLGAILGILLVAAASYEWRREERLSNLAMAAFWTILYGTIHVLPMFAAARTGVPLGDGLLDRADRLIGVHVPDIVRWAGRHRGLREAFGYCYSSLVILMVLPALIPPMLGDMASFKRFAIGCVAAIAISFPIFAAFQAVGPWAYYGYSPQVDQSAYTAMFARLRSRGAVLLDLDYSSGLICFPSFHTVLAILSSAALMSTPYFRWAAGVWGGLIVASTVATGTHYVVDVVAGLLIARASLAAGRMYSDFEAAPRVRGLDG